jgi:hypothetical protein
MVTGMTAAARPLEATLMFPVQVLLVPDVATLTVRVAGVLPETGVTERKFEHVVPVTVTVKGEVPAVEAMAIVWVVMAAAPAPPPVEVRLREAGLASAAGLEATAITTGMESGLLVASATVTDTEPE